MIYWLKQGPFWRVAGCHLQQRWGSRCKRCGPQHRQASQQKASGISLHSPPHGPLLPPSYTLRNTHTHTHRTNVCVFQEAPFHYPLYTDDTCPLGVYSWALWSSSALWTTWRSLVDHYFQRRQINKTSWPLISPGTVSTSLCKNRIWMADPSYHSAWVWYTCDCFTFDTIFIHKLK